MTKFFGLFAVAFGADGFSGDSTFAYGGAEGAVEAREDSSLEELRALHREKDEDPSFYEEPLGFWLLTPESLSVIDVIFDEEAGSDGETYVQHNAAKRLCAKLAVRTVGSFPEDT